MRIRIMDLRYPIRTVKSADDEPTSTIPSNYGGLLKEHHHYPWHVGAAPAKPKI